MTMKEMNKHEGDRLVVQGIDVAPSRKSNSKDKYDARDRGRSHKSEDRSSDQRSKQSKDTTDKRARDASRREVRESAKEGAFEKSKDGRTYMTVGDKTIIKRHVNQLFVRGDNVVMVALVD